MRINQGLGGDISHDAWAVFGQISVPFGDKLIVDFGLRYTDESKKSDQVVGQTDGFCDVTTGICDTNFNGDESWSNVTPSLTAPTSSPTTSCCGPATSGATGAAALTCGT